MFRFNVWDIRKNNRTHMFGGESWVVDGEAGRMCYPGWWPVETARDYYRRGWSYQHDVIIPLPSV